MQGFSVQKNKDYALGDIVELPETYIGFDFLELVVEEPREPEKSRRK